MAKQRYEPKTFRVLNLMPFTMSLELIINSKNEKTILVSFNSIPKNLFNNFPLNRQGTLYNFTEIEFYYLNAVTHADKYSHKHSCGAGKWRFRLQGLDILLGYQKEDGYYLSYGGILIHGIAFKQKYINGPKRLLASIFEQLGNINETKKIGLIRKKSTPHEIIRSTRKGLSENAHRTMGLNTVTKTQPNAGIKSMCRQSNKQ